MSEKTTAIEETVQASMHAERTILGAVLLDPGHIRRPETELLRPDDFALDSHRKIYAAMLQLAENDVQIDMVTLTEQLAARKQVESVGGVSYISSLIDGVPDRPSVASYVDIVRRRSIAREVVAAAQAAIAECVDCDSPQKVIANLQAKISSLALDTMPSENLFVPWSKFRQHGQERISWLVDGVIEQGTNGFLLGLPKARKSLSAVDLAVALASGTTWLQFKVKTNSVAFISREDYPGTTSRRIKRAMRARDIDPEAKWWDDFLWLNSRAEAQHLMLTNMANLRNVIKQLKERSPEFLFLDVLKVMHESDENDSQEMGRVLRCIEQIHAEVGCQVCIVHHSRKNWEDGMTLSEITRGSSVIAGFAEFLIGMRLVDEEQDVVQAKFETKAAHSHRPIYWKAEDYDATRSTSLVRKDDYMPTKKSAKHNGSFKDNGNGNSASATMH